jgi:hypothetical protein
MPSVPQFASQAAVYAVIAAVVGYFSTFPRYHQVPEGQAQIKLALQHGGARIEDCRKLTTKELSKLPSAERRPITCSRERVPLTIEVSIDGAVIYADVLPPTGLSGDGVSKAYKKFLVPAGHHVIEAKLRDSKRPEGFDFDQRVEAELKPWQNFAIDFSAEQGGFLFR